MENHNSQEMLQRIKSKLGFDIRNYKADDTDKNVLQRSALEK